MVVLCALVRVVGLPPAVPLLAQYGLRSHAWRTREGTLRLVIAGLLSWRPVASTGLETGAEEAGLRKSGLLSGEIQVVSAKKGSGTGGRGHGGAVAMGTTTGAEEILCDVGSLLKDDRPEVCTDPLVNELTFWNPTSDCNC